MDLEEEHIGSRFDKVGEVSDGANILFEQGLRASSNALDRPSLVVATAFAGVDAHCGGAVLGSLRNFLSDEILIAKALIINSEVEELVEVEVVLHEELNVTRLELTCLVAQNVRLRPHIDIKWS